MIINHTQIISMGQNQDRDLTSRVIYDSNSDNGLVLSSIYVPEELLADILHHADPMTLLNCQLVCKRWNHMIKSYVWRKKAELVFGKSLNSVKNLPWCFHYYICRGKLFEKNLMKNHSGQNGLDQTWQILSHGGDHWKIETPPEGVPPLPNETVFEAKKSCFVTSYYTCSKRQIIDLISEGFNSQILDTFQPPIVIGEWYSARWDCPAIYELSVILANDRNEEMDRFQFYDSIDGETQNQWHHVSHEFKNYGSGLRKIIFQHSGKDSLFWAGHYGSKMAGASIIMKIPQELPSKCEKRKISSSSLDLDAKLYNADLESESDSDLINDEIQ